MARYLREKAGLGAGDIDLMIDLQARAREALKKVERSQERRAAVLWEIIRDPASWEALSRGADAAWEYVEGRYLHG
jgi:hypothetical protein